MDWLYEAKKLFHLRVLNYMVTSNHIHLLVINSGEKVISKSLQLIAGRTGQAYNQRKGRSGGYWEDRYHATAIETGEHFIQCLVYIGLNMVRAGAGKHPSVLSHKFLYTPFVVSLSNHERNPLKYCTLRQAQGERDL
jgi:putative transposase